MREKIVEMRLRDITPEIYEENIDRFEEDVFPGMNLDTDEYSWVNHKDIFNEDFLNKTVIVTIWQPTLLDFEEIQILSSLCKLKQTNSIILILRSSNQDNTRGFIEYDCAGLKGKLPEKDISNLDLTEYKINIEYKIPAIKLLEF